MKTTARDCYSYIQCIYIIIQKPSLISFVFLFLDDFMKQGNGLIIFWTLKNPSFPECYFEADSGVMCLDIHPQHQHYIAAGFYDGSVAVFSTVDRKDGPLHRCTAKNGKHTDPVWQVRHNSGIVYLSHTEPSHI